MLRVNMNRPKAVRPVQVVACLESPQAHISIHQGINGDPIINLVVRRTRSAPVCIAYKRGPTLIMFN